MINSVQIDGNIVADPELKTVPSGDKETVVVNFSIANNRKIGDRKETTFVDCEAWDSGARSISDRFKKGDPIIVFGLLKQERWENAEGQKRSKMKLRVNTFCQLAKYEKPADTTAPETSDEPVAVTTDTDEPPF